MDWTDYMKVRLLTFLLLINCIVLPCLSPSLSVAEGLEQFVESLQANNLQLKKQQAIIENQKHNLSIAQGTFLPKLDAKANIKQYEGSQGVRVVSGGDNIDVISSEPSGKPYSYGLVLSQPILKDGTFFGINSQYFQIADTALKTEVLRKDKMEMELIRELTSLFIKLSGNRLKLEHWEKVKECSNQSVSIFKEKVNFGLMEQNALENALQKNLQVLNTIGELEHLVRTVSKKIKYLAVVDESVAADSIHDITALDREQAISQVSAAEFTNRVVQNSLDLALLRMEKQRLSHEYDENRDKAIWPVLSLSGTYLRSDDLDIEESSGGDYWDVRLDLKMNLYNSGTDITKVKQSRVNMRAHEYEIQNKAQELLLSIDEIRSEISLLESELQRIDINLKKYHYLVEQNVFNHENGMVGFEVLCNSRVLLNEAYDEKINNTVNLWEKILYLLNLAGYRSAGYLY